MGVHDGAPILDPATWQQGDDTDRAAWGLAAAEDLLSVLRDYLAVARRSYYRPGDPSDWSVPDMERHLARAETVAAGRSDADRETFNTAAADFLGALPPAMKDDLRRGTLKR